MKNPVHSTDAITEFLSEFASHLLSRGMGVSEFQNAAKVAFVNAAVRGARLRNSRVNQSAVAAITGMSRAQVRSALQDSKRSPSSWINRIITAWGEDKEFADSNGKPRVLRINLGHRGFSALVRKYAGDISYRAILSELLRLGCVRQIGRSLELIEPAIVAKQHEAIRILSQGLSHVIRGTPDEPLDRMQLITGEAEFNSPDETSMLILRRRIAQGAKAFTADIQSAGDALQSQAKSGRGKSRKTRTRILVVTVG